MAKKKETSKFTSWDEVAAALRDMRDIELRRKKAEVNMNNAMTHIKAQYEENDKPEKAAFEALEKQVMLFTKEHEADFIDKKSREFTFGTVGFKVTTEIITNNIKAIIGALKNKGMTDCITTTVTEKINKGKLSEYSDEAIKAVGARRRTEEKYFYKLNLESLEG